MRKSSLTNRTARAAELMKGDKPWHINFASAPGHAARGPGMHAPDEKFHLPNFFKGIATSIRFLAEMAGQPIDLLIAARRGLTPSKCDDGGSP